MMRSMLDVAPLRPPGDQACTYCRLVVPERDVRWPRWPRWPGRPYCSAHEAHDGGGMWLDRSCVGCWKLLAKDDVRWRGDRTFCRDCHGDSPAGDQACDRCKTDVPEHAVRWRHYGRELLPYCQECLGRECTRCRRAPYCPREVSDCAVCGRPVCFFERDHSVRMDRTTCCLECVRGVLDVRGRVVALLDHLPAGIVRAIACVEERSVGRYERALKRTASQWPKCTGCRERVPSIPRVPLVCDSCGRVTKSEKPRCVDCRAWRTWRCRACRV